MSAKRKSFKVRQGHAHLTVYPWTHPASGAARWRFAWRDDTRRWRYQTHKTKAEAETAAWRILEEATGGLVWSGLDADSRRFLEEIHRRTGPDDRAALLAFMQSRQTSGEVGAAVQRFLDHKRAEAGGNTPHLAQVASLLETMAAHFSGHRVTEIRQPELQAWWEERDLGRASKTRLYHRSILVSFWRWCLRQGIGGHSPITEAERLPTVKLASGARRILTPDELCAVLNAVREPWRAWVVLGAFAGLRPEEIAPSSHKLADKRGIHCEELDWQFGVIRLPAQVSKVKRPRIVPMGETLQHALEWAGIGPGMQGPVCLQNPSRSGELARLGASIFQGAWPQDSLRHSYGSYRNAIVRSLDQVAEEMGTSVTMLHRHYHNPQAEAEGQAWFMIRYDPMKRRFTTQHVDSIAPLETSKTA